MDSLMKLRDMLMEELDHCAEKDEIRSDNALHRIDKLTHAVKSIDTILAMEDAGYSNDGYSYARRRRDSMGRYSRGYHDDMSYDGRSYNYSRRGRSNRGYSRDDAKADLINQLDDIWESTDDESMKHMIEEWKRQAEQR